MDQGTVFFGLIFALAALTIGFVSGTRFSRSQRRVLQRQLAQRELTLLDVRSEQVKRQSDADRSGRREALLSLLMRRLGDSESRVRTIEGVLDAQERRNIIGTARLVEQIERGRARTREATALARRATTQLKRLETASSGPQTITAREPKSYGNGCAHTVSVVDKGTLAARRDAVSRVSNRDSARFSVLSPSNETPGRMALCGLQSVDGITPALERRLNEAGIHRVEQLADLSDHDADALDRLMKTSTRTLGVDWQGSARRALGRRIELPGA